MPAASLQVKMKRYRKENIKKTGDNIIECHVCHRNIEVKTVTRTCYGCGATLKGETKVDGELLAAK